MKIKFTHIAIIALLFMGVGALLWSGFEKDNPEDLKGLLDANYSTINGNASGTPTYLSTNTATTTLTTLNIGGVDSIGLSILFDASTTASVLDWEYQFSHDGEDWFGENASTQTSTLLQTHASGTKIHTFTPNTALNNLIHINNIPVNAKFFRMRVSVSEAAGSVWGILHRDWD